MWKGILLNKSFIDESIIESFSVVNKKTDGTWVIYLIDFADKDLAKTIQTLQNNMHSGKPFYNHLYNGNDLIVVFKGKYFNATTNKNSWNDVLEYGKTLGIPEKQLDFIPRNKSQEDSYFDSH